jgi:hypothetical protein
VTLDDQEDTLRLAPGAVYITLTEEKDKTHG